MKIILTVLLLSISSLAISQRTLSDNFQIGNYVEIFNTDSIKVYFNCTGTVYDKKCADYYRVGKRDTTMLNVTGDFRDYYLNGKLCLKATMVNDNLEGVAYYYYENGNVKAEGAYQNNTRRGKWTFYYPKGNVQKVYEYTDGEPVVLEAYSSNGKVTVLNKNGNFKTEFSVYNQCGKYQASGQIKNGRKDGQWKFFGSLNAATPISIETFNEGNFIKGGGNNHEYTDKPRISFNDFNANENLYLYDNALGCPGNKISLWRYDNQIIHSSFYPELQKELSKYDKPIQNQWLVVGITINKKNNIDAINISSSINDENLENYIYRLLSKMTLWETAVINLNTIESDIFFTILVKKNQFIIPTDYVFRNRRN